MIVDAHNHVGGPDKGNGKKQYPEEIVSVMDRVGIDKAVIFSFNEINAQTFSSANDYIAKAVAKYPYRLIGFARLDPNYKEKAIFELNRAIDELGLQELKLHPSAQKFSIISEEVKEIIKVAKEKDIPVIFDSGKKASPPEDFGILAELFPSSKIIMAHMYGNFLEVAKKHSNIYLQTTGMPRIEIIKNALETLGAERIISGSDSPYISMERELEKIRSIPNLTDKERELILGENIRRILKL